MTLEEGEVCDEQDPSTSSREGQRVPDITGVTYSAVLEWPGDNWTDTGDVGKDIQTPGSHSHLSPSLRLRVQHSSVLAKKHYIAILDGYTEVQLGRDIPPPGSDVPRLRLKEMEVSKLHATIYWDTDRSEWAVVDMGSKHGTFIKHHPRTEMQGSLAAVSSSISHGQGSEDPRGIRLSPARTASVPRRLSHLDQLTLGSTTFIVHIHNRQIPCVDCSSKGGDEILLSDSRQLDSTSSNKRKREREIEVSDVPSHSTSPLQQDPKKALSTLKRSLLSRHASVTRATNTYIDRSARRRALYPVASPVIPTNQEALAVPSASYSDRPAIDAAPSISNSQPPPLSDSNIGHRLLLKQGWQPGTSLGQPNSSDIALVEPLEVIPRFGRAGLGVPATPADASQASSGSGWKEDGKLRRWAAMRSAGDAPRPAG